MLKFIVDNLDGIEEAHKAFYAKGEDGKFHLQVEGAADKSKVDEFRNSNITLRQELEQLQASSAKFKDVDLDQYAQMLKTAQDQKDKKMIDAGQIDQVVEERVSSMRTEMQKAIDELTGTNQGLTGQLEKYLIDGSVATAASKAGAKGTAIDVISLLARQVFKLKDGQAIPMEGDKTIYGKDGSTPKSVPEWITELQETRPFLFEESTGGGGQGGGGGGGNKTVDRGNVVAFGDNLADIASGKIEAV